MAPSWAPSGSDDSDKRQGPTFDDRPGLGGVSETKRRDKIVSIIDQRPDTPYTIGELTVTLSEWFQTETEGMIPTDEEIHSVLYDFDLPRLEEGNRLIFDRETGRVFSTDKTQMPMSKSSQATSKREPSHTKPETPPETGTTVVETNSDGVPTARVVELGILLFGVAGVALTASSISPFDTSYALVPVGLVVLFFGYQSLTRR